jgi:ribosome maturation factor RimP
VNEFSGLIDNIKSSVAGYLDSNNLVLVELKLFRQSGKLNIRFLLDYHQGGITLERCTRANQDIGTIFDENNLIGESYLLEVSSPGIDRPLVNEADFRRAKGKDLDVYLSRKINNSLQFSGRLIQVDVEGILIDTNKEQVRINYQDINKARLKI